MSQAKPAILEAVPQGLASRTFGSRKRTLETLMRGKGEGYHRTSESKKIIGNAAGQYRIRAKSQRPSPNELLDINKQAGDEVDWAPGMRYFLTTLLKWLNRGEHEKYCVLRTHDVKENPYVGTDEELVEEAMQLWELNRGTVGNLGGSSIIDDEQTDFHDAVGYGEVMVKDVHVQPDEKHGRQQVDQQDIRQRSSVAKVLHPKHLTLGQQEAASTIASAEPVSVRRSCIPGISHTKKTTEDVSEPEPALSRQSIEYGMSTPLAPQNSHPPPQQATTITPMTSQPVKKQLQKSPPPPRYSSEPPVPNQQALILRRRLQAYLDHDEALFQHAAIAAQGSRHLTTMSGTELLKLGDRVLMRMKQRVEVAMMSQSNPRETP